jgi:hypothetical protein
MSFAPRLSAMPALLTPTLIAAWTLIRRWLRSHDLFLRLSKLYLLAIVILPVGMTTILRLCRLRPLRTALSCAAPPSSTATRRKLTARLPVDHACFGIGICRYRISIL